MVDSGLWAVVPVKDPHEAKQRLAPVLAPAERESLFRAMLEDVLEALAAVEGLAGVLLVTRDDSARALAAARGFRVLGEDANRGHTRAARRAARTLAAEGAAGMVQIPADVPLVTPADVAALLAAHDAAPAVTVAPSRDARGSNAVACSPPDVLRLRFGEDSFFPHLERARSLGIEPRVVERAGLALDVDTPDDLVAFVETPSSTRAYGYVVETGIAQRLEERARRPAGDS